MRGANIPILYDSSERLYIPTFKVDLKHTERSGDPSDPEWSEYFVDATRDLESFKEYVNNCFQDFEVVAVTEIEVVVY